MRQPSWWHRHWLAILYLVSALIVVGQRLQPGRHGVFLIFRTAFFDLIAQRNLYATHTAEHLDYFRYSPTFALLFAPIAILPWPAGVMAWTLLNAFALYWILGRLLPRGTAQIVRCIVLGDLVRSLQSSQSNALVTAVMIAAYLAYERDERWVGGWAVASGGLVLGTSRRPGTFTDEGANRPPAARPPGSGA